MVVLSARMGVLFIGLLLAATAQAGAPSRTCPAGQRPGIGGCVPAVPSARKRPDPPPKRDSTAPPPQASLRPEATAPSLTKLASHRLLLQELQRLEALLKVTPRDAPERPAMLRRLAEAYAELARAAEHDREIAKLRAERAEREEKRDKPPAPKRRRTVL